MSTITATDTTATSTVAPTIAPTVAPSTTAAAAGARTRPLWHTGAVSGIVAAVATTVMAAAALAADVPLEVAGEQIPLLGFAQMTLLGAAIGVGLAKGLRRWAARPQRSFVVATVVLTVLSIVPDLTIDATTASKLVLIATHVVAAAIVVPAVARRLPTQR